MGWRLAENVQVRKESWGLLFYAKARHKVCFVKSGDWLYPRHFDGTWTYEDTVHDIAARTGSTAETIERSLPRLQDHLKANRIISDEVC